MKSLVCALVVTVTVQMLGFSAQCRNIKNDVFRLHIIANSDSRYDQLLKMCVRNRILMLTQELYSGASSAEQAQELTKAALDSIKSSAEQVIRQNGYDYTVEATLGEAYFGTRKYGAYTLPAGTYNALNITIGEGKGHNWWCVMFPSLCLPAAEGNCPDKCFSDSENDIIKNGVKYEYKFKIVEIFENIRNCFAH